MTELNNRTYNNKFFILDRIFLISIFFYGIYIRMSEYLANRSIWLDEASLALNIVGKSFYELLTQPLNYNQAAPIGFLLLTKFIVSMFGKSEFVFRVIPLISSFISFFVLYQISIKCLSRKFTWIPLFLFATSTELLRYATEFKQYSSDVLFALIIALNAISFSEHEYSCKTGVTFGIIGAAVLWFSFPSLFMMGGAGIVLFFSYVVEKKWKNIKNLLISFFFWGVSFVLMYFFFLKDIGSNALFEQYWSNDFMPLPPYTISDQLWFAERIVKIFYYPGMINQALIGLIAAIIGAYAIFRKQKIFFILLLPLCLTLIASSIHRYPFEGRVILFYVPFLYLLVAGGLSFLINKSSYFSKALGVGFLISILYPALIMAYGQLSSRVVYREEIKPILNYVKIYQQKEDMIYVYYGADRAFQYYIDSYGFDNERCITGISSRQNLGKYHADLDQLKGKKRVWVIFTHVYSAQESSEERYMVDYMGSIGKRLDMFRSVRASVYLYDFTSS